MNIRPNIFVILFMAILTFLCIVMSCFFVSSVNRDFSLEVECERINNNISNIKYDIENKTHELEVTVKDWAIWDDTYSLIKKWEETKQVDEGYIKNNLHKNWMNDLELDFWVLVNKSGEIIFKSPEGFDNRLPTKKIAELKRGSGFVRCGNDLYLLAFMNVTRSDKSESSEGILIMGKSFNSKTIRTNNEITISSYEGTVLKDKEKANSHGVVRISSENEMCGAIAVLDVFGDVNTEISFKLKKSFFNHFNKTTNVIQMGVSFLFIVLFSSTFLLMRTVRNYFFKNKQNEFKSEMINLNENKVTV